GCWGLRQADDRHSAGNVLVTALTTTLGPIGPLRSKQSSALLFSSDHLIDLGLSLLWRKIRRSQCPLITQSRQQFSACAPSTSYGRYAACFAFASKRASAFFPSLAAAAMLSKKIGELSRGPHRQAR